MRVKFLSNTGSFGGVRYNTNKMDQQKGELMSIKNFGLLQENAFDLKPDEVKNYLKSWSASNSRVKDAQFHVTISCKGRENTKEELTQIAEKWLGKMGYDKNPYIVVFHSDTDNNHVHIVSSRIDKNGKKINDSFEGDRGNRELQKIIKQSPGYTIIGDAPQIESYYFTTSPQLKLLYAQKGYNMREQDGVFNIYKTGELVKTYSDKEIETLINKKEKNEKRIKQLKAIINKYKETTDNTLVCQRRKLAGGREGKIIGYKSDLTELLKEKFGIETVFHFKDNKPPYGFTLIDHKGKAVFKGSEIIKLNQFVGNKEPLKFSETDKRAIIANKYNVEIPEHAEILSRFFKISQYKIISQRHLEPEKKKHYKTMLNYFLRYNATDNLERKGKTRTVINE